MNAVTISSVALGAIADINREHRAAQTCAADAVKHAIRCGELLIEQKKRLDHGEFQKWIKLNCEFAYSTAARYLKAADQKSTGVEFCSLSELFPSGRPGAIKKTVPSKPIEAVTTITAVIAAKAPADTDGDFVPLMPTDDADDLHQRAQREHQDAQQTKKAAAPTKQSPSLPSLMPLVGTASIEQIATLATWCKKFPDSSAIGKAVHAQHSPEGCDQLYHNIQIIQRWISLLELELIGDEPRGTP